MTRQREAERWVQSKLQRAGGRWRARPEGGFWRRDLGVLVEVRNGHSSLAEAAKRESHLCRTAAIVYLVVDAFDDRAADEIARAVQLLDSWNARRRILGLPGVE